MDKLELFGQLGQKVEVEIQEAKHLLNTTGTSFEKVRDKIAQALCSLNNMLVVADGILEVKQDPQEYDACKAMQCDQQNAQRNDAISHLHSPIDELIGKSEK
jgi:hypothetical protein